jgi:hypothetical protein
MRTRRAQMMLARTPVARANANMIAKKTINATNLIARTPAPSAELRPKG